MHQRSRSHQEASRAVGHTVASSAAPKTQPQCECCRTPCHAIVAPFSLLCPIVAPLLLCPIVAPLLLSAIIAPLLLCPVIAPLLLCHHRTVTAFCHHRTVTAFCHHRTFTALCHHRTFTAFCHHHTLTAPSKLEQVSYVTSHFFIKVLFFVF